MAWTSAAPTCAEWVRPNRMPMLTPIKAAEIIPVLTAWSRCCVFRRCVSILFGFNSAISDLFLIIAPVIIAVDSKRHDVGSEPMGWVMKQRRLFEAK